MTEAIKEHYSKLAKYYNSKTKTYREIFKGECPYTSKKCDDWNCPECEVEQAEREYMKGENE